MDAFASAAGGIMRCLSLALLPPPSGQIANGDEVVAAQKSAVLRREALYQQGDPLPAKYTEIEEMKKPLQLRIYDPSLKAD
jgi:hypothetical protein